MAISQIKRARAGAGWLCFAAFAALCFAPALWNPMDYVFEAGPSAYFQARVAYERGGPRERERVRDACRDGKISLADYSKAVFASYMRVAHDDEELFPARERNKPLDQLRAELQAAIRSEPPVPARTGT